MTIPVVITIFMGLLGSGGIIFGALRYNRDETGKIVATQSTIVTDMRGLNEELNESLTRLRGERDELLGEVKACRSEIAELSTINARLAREYRNIEREKEELLNELRRCRVDIKAMRDEMRKS